MIILNIFHTALLHFRKYALVNLFFILFHIFNKNNTPIIIYIYTYFYLEGLCPKIKTIFILLLFCENVTVPIEFNIINFRNLNL